MRKITIMLIIALIMLSGNNSSYAEHKEDKISVSSEDVLKSILYPKLLQIVDEQYGGPNVDWSIEGVENVSLKKNNNDIWYEVQLSLKINQSKKEHYDNVTLKTDVYNPNTNEVALLNYQKGK
ncbi:hypothetical protein SAMN05444673_4090 [Bacillus sp. OV166]|uniref:hypothetical protein n=1 Tax=Bacillus sp. OV166 TaxID=1882763 RepID=UPI000A2AD87A|nr:hypothetical protein [Bacillus sp. OV166]SMQ81012.1 hypothetical protein SAMN05444673_4090 [Bacillus sp. OV166]